MFYLAVQACGRDALLHKVSVPQRPRQPRRTPALRHQRIKPDCTIFRADYCWEVELWPVEITIMSVSNWSAQVSINVRGSLQPNQAKALMGVVAQHTPTAGVASHQGS